ncbi:uncharacterized protein BO80DRAFT_463058 [Aspergillus ibericus CBS 121593]|uniref:AA1-like domain-containing protein n=1 Tax=Aspergillus ibericus CBS 121593 TaxID=1448316 RepID=A0A395H5C1_9EURO|nr:hypothetical protein BO80DRAFT_463058 [Aspergillus ibericus CBS 121593]RAL02803.1 hypothetical protein BO80DRAFT_463058 [Aspergillus ibericus CBS 121593]
MHLSTFLLLLPLPFLPGVFSSSLDTLRFKNWDLRLFTPGCNPNTTSLDLSVFHAQGVSGTDGCTPLDSSVNVSSVDSFSWKSPGATRYDLCLYEGCGEDGTGRVEVVRDGWEVCVGYWGWRGWRAVEADGAC